MLLGLSLGLSFLLLLVLLILILKMLGMWREQVKLQQDLILNMENSYRSQVQSLMNRAVSKDWQTFQVLEGSQAESHTSQLNSDYYGMSDEEELIRSASSAHGVGEIILDLDDFDQEILSDGFNFNSP